MRALGLPLGLLFLWSCAGRAPIQTADQALRPTSAPKLDELFGATDDLPYASWVSGLSDHLARFQKINAARESDSFLTVGKRVVTVGEFTRSLARLLEVSQSAPDFASLWPKLTEEFEFLEVYGDQSPGDVFITGYYDLDVRGSRRKKAPYTQPIYAAPKDMIVLDLSAFDPKFSAERSYRARLEKNKLLPYPARAEIDGPERALKGKSEILCYLDPIDAFLLQVQGSGRVRLADSPEKLILNYADKNGQAYVSIGKFLKQQRPDLDVNLHVLERHLRSLDPPARQSFLNQNPSYVFFKRGENPAITTFGTTAVDGRTIASDARFFPKGGVGLLISEKAVYAQPDAEVPSAWAPFARLILDQDTGGAITGAGRVDLFFGKDAEAKRLAGAMKRRGKLYYFLLKTNI